MAEEFYLRVRTANNGPAINHSGSHESVDKALRAAEGAVLDRGEFVWIVDDAGNLMLPADQVRVRLNHPSPSLQNS